MENGNGIAHPDEFEGAVSNTPIGRVQLGDHTYAIYEQRIGYLENRLKRDLGVLIGAELEGRSPLDALGHSAYKVLRVFIGGRMMPEWEFRGYPTEEAWKAGDHDERYDKSPGARQIRAAIKTCAEVNSLDFFGALRKLFSEESAQRLGDLLLVKAMEWMRNNSLELPPNALPPSTESDPTSSGATPSTPDADETSPELENAPAT